MNVDVCIRGAGVVGKTLALLLARAQIRVALVAGPPPLRPDIRAFALNTASKTLLQGLRAWPDNSTGVQQMQVWGDDGGRVQFEAQGEAALASIVDAAALEQLLDTAVSFQPLIALSNQAAAASLTVVCEGKNSATRALLGVDFEVSSYGQQAIAAQIDCERPHGGIARQWMQGGEILALLPRQNAAPSGINSPPGGHNGNSVALVWSVSDEHATALMAMEPEAFTRALQNACAAGSGAHATAPMTAPAASPVGPASDAAGLGALRLASERAVWPLFKSTAQRWVGQHATVGAWALAGDAAHTVHPLAGQGLNLGLADAAVLAQTLADKEYFRSYGDMRLLRRYERARAGDAAALRNATDALQRLFASDDSRIQAARNWGMNGFNALAPLKAAVMRRAMGL